MIPKRLLSTSTRRWLVAVALLSLTTVAIGFVLRPASAWPGFLVASVFYLTLSLGAVAFLALARVAHAGWTAVLVRTAEAVTAWLPLGALTMLTVLGGAAWLYPWAAGHVGEMDEGKRHFLSLGFFATRMVVILGLWLVFSHFLCRNSRAQDSALDLGPTRRNVALSALFIVVLALSFSLASFDWLMSVEPEWASTIFALYQIGGLLVGSVSLLIVVATLARRRGLLPALSESHLHDLGKLAFGFATLWAYLWFSQYMLVWYANLPEETAHYRLRTAGGWSFLFYLNPIVGWLVPFLALLPRPAKRSEAHLFRVALLLLGAHWLDLYLMVAPARFPEHHGIDGFSLAALVGLGAAFTVILDRALASKPLLPHNDPYLVEALHHKT